MTDWASTGMVANLSVVSCFAPENFASRDRFGCTVPRQPAHSPHAGGIWCLPTTKASSSPVNRHRDSVPSLPGQAIAYRWRLLPRVRRHRISSPQISSSNGRCLFRYHHGPIFARLSFPTPTVGTVDMC